MKAWNSTFKVGTTPLKRSTKPMQSIGARAKRTRQGKVPPTAIERAWLDAIAGAGCIVCLLHYCCFQDSEIHHIKHGDRRMGHLFTLPLCPPHHRTGGKDGIYIALHPWKTRWVKAYGTELELLAIVQAMVGNAALEADTPVPSSCQR